MSENKEPAAIEVDVAANLVAVNDAIAAAAKAAGRDGGEAGLVAVSKTQPATAIGPTIQAGQRVFGENRVYRGGSCLSKERRTRFAFRHKRHPGFRGDYVGFRIVRSHSE